jgi:hypothetical protein
MERVQAYGNVGAISGGENEVAAAGEDEVDQRAPDGGDELGPGAMGRADKGQAAEGPHEDVGGLAADGAAGESMAELVQEHAAEEKDQPARSPEHVAAVEQLKGDQDEKSDVDADADAGDRADGKGPVEQAQDATPASAPREAPAPAPAPAPGVGIAIAAPGRAAGGAGVVAISEAHG